MNKEQFRILHMNLDTGKARKLDFGDRAAHLGGSGLAAALYAEYGLPEEDAFDPRQPLIFAIGPLTAYFPLMSKVVCGFKSPYTQQFAESHAGGRLALSMRFAGYDAIVVTGTAKSLSVLEAGGHSIEVHDVHYLRGVEAFAAGKHFRRFGKSSAGHRSMIRIGPAGENKVAYACINVDTYRHFGRMGAGAVMGAKNLKAILVLGDRSLPLPEGKAYPKLYKEFYGAVTGTDMMKKYHDLGTPENLVVLNELKALPWRNLQQTTDPAIEGISGERFAKQFLLRQVACSGCPVGCVHIGLLRHLFASDHEFLYRQVSYDFEPLFSQGSMLGMENASDVLAMLDLTDKLGLDVMSSGVALAWATEALERGVVGMDETVVPLRWGDLGGFLESLRHLAFGTNEFYRALGQGTLVAARQFGGEDFACVLGQEMAGYATGEVFFTSQALGFRHSHLDSGGYSFDQKAKEKDADRAVNFMLCDERARIQLTCMVSCLFARTVYTPDKVLEALDAVGLSNLAQGMDDSLHRVQQLRWALKFQCGYDPAQVAIPKRFLEVVNWKGPIDPAYLDELRQKYGAAITDLARKGAEPTVAE